MIYRHVVSDNKKVSLEIEGRILFNYTVYVFSSELQFIRSHRACWYGSATDGALTNIQANKDLEDHSRNSNK